MQCTIGANCMVFFSTHINFWISFTKSTYMKTFNNIAELAFIKLPVYKITVLLMGSNLLHAQHEHHVTMAKTGKNVYIDMMDTMMASMHNVSNDNTPDTAFLQQMISHHHGNVAMAEYEIMHGKSAEVVTLA